jgi:hypothetical protein
MVFFFKQNHVYLKIAKPYPLGRFALYIVLFELWLHGIGV